MPVLRHRCGGVPRPELCQAEYAGQYPHAAHALSLPDFGIEENMPLFAVQYTYAPEKSAERDDHRTDHRAWLADLVRRHIVQSSGPFADGSGALMMVEAATADDVIALFDQDPFAKRGLVAARLVREWIPVFGVFVK
ncbi:hypothetical protein RE9425_21090 [Prescottella equi]|nr:hypothetical protein RE9425_21090 [Prescottella equi]